MKVLVISFLQQVYYYIQDDQEKNLPFPKEKRSVYTKYFLIKLEIIVKGRKLPIKYVNTCITGNAKMLNTFITVTFPLNPVFFSFSVLRPSMRIIFIFICHKNAFHC